MVFDKNVNFTISPSKGWSWGGVGLHYLRQCYDIPKQGVELGWSWPALFFHRIQKSDIKNDAPVYTKRWFSIDFHWFSMDFYEHSTIFNGFVWIFNDFQWISVDFRLIFSGFPRIVNDFQWISTDFHRISTAFQWNSKDFQRFSMDFVGFSKIFNDFPRISSSSILNGFQNLFKDFQMDYTYFSQMLWVHVTTLVDAANVACNVNKKRL